MLAYFLHQRLSVVCLVCCSLILPALGARSADREVVEEPKTHATENSNNAVDNCVVRVFATLRLPDPYRPWTKQAPSDVSGSGVIIEGKRILTSAHVVSYASQVEIQANQAGDKVSARVEAEAPGIDLAVLKLDDDSFFDAHPPLARANKLPGIKDAVMAYGYSKGGSSLSITKGIVSRIEFASYNYPVSGLRIQIDAAINPGNSGGPAVVGDKMIGLAFSHLGGAENVGYIVPSEEIDLFLQDISDGHYDGKPAIFDDFQTLENPALRSFLNLDKSVEGLVVHKADSEDPAYPLKTWDIIRRIGDTPVDDQGMVKIGENLRVRFEYLVQKFTKNGKVPITVVRAGKEIAVDVPVSAERPMVIPPLRGAYPSYFVYGPLVFSEATSEFIAGLNRTTGGRNAMLIHTISGSSLVSRLLDKPAFPEESLVVIASPFFPHKLSKGYSNPFSEIVKYLNKQPVKNLGHLVQLLHDSKDEFIRIEFENRHAETLVFPRAEMVAATEGILTDNGVRTQGSPNMLAIWQAKESASSK